MDDLQRLVVRALALDEEKGSYMLVSKAWCSLVKEISQNSVLHSYWDNVQHAEDLVYMHLYARCDCHFGEHVDVNCKTERVEVIITTFQHIKTAYGVLYGLPVQIGYGNILLEKPLSGCNLESMILSVARVKALADQWGLELTVDVEVREVLLTLSTYFQVDLGTDIWLPIRLI